MKKLSRVLMVGALALGIAGPAQAVEVKISGQWDFAFGWAENTRFRDNGNDYRAYGEDHVVARQRVRTQVNFIASENLQGVLMFEIGDITWGRGDTVGQGSGGGLDADGVNVETKRAYLDWMIPETRIAIRMGIQGIALPSATDFGNPVLNSDVAGIMVSAPIDDMFAITAFWARPFDQYDFDGDKRRDDETDLFGLMVPITGEGWTVTPWGAYARVGSASGFYDYVLNYNGHMDDLYGSDTSIGGGDNHANAWWAGLGVSVDLFDPLTFTADVMYGQMGKSKLGRYDNDTYVERFGNIGTKGWFADASLDYKLDWGTPGIFGWWSSGDSDNAHDDGRYGRLPAMGFDDGFHPTSFGTPGSVGIGTDGVLSSTALGTWGIGAQLADLSFVENLSHTLRVAYYRGTNDSDLIKNSNTFVPLSGESMYLTDEDYAVEVNFDHKYRMYENLDVFLELGYIHLNLDGGTWNGVHAEYDDTDNAWKAQVLFQYKF